MKGISIYRVIEDFIYIQSCLIESIEKLGEKYGCTSSIGKTASLSFVD